jgi:hypothetical protein
MINHIQFPIDILTETRNDQAAAKYLLACPCAICLWEKAPNDAGAVIGHEVVTVEREKLLPTIDVTTRN